MKLYNHALAPNPRRVRIFAAEKGIKLALEEVDILAGQTRKTRQARCRCSNLMTVHASPSQSQSADIWRGFTLKPNLLGRDLREQAEIERWNRRMELELFAPISRTFHKILTRYFKSVSSSFQNMERRSESAIVKRSPVM
jgi:glutathione S-transferase